MSSARPRICIITPGQIGSNPRVVKEAQALHEIGCHVCVIATRSLDRVEPRDQSLMKRIPWRLVRVDLRGKWHWRAYRLLQTMHRKRYAISRSARDAFFGFRAGTRPLVNAVIQVPADLYIAHYPAALPAAFLAASRVGAKFSYDAEDFHLGDWPDEPRYDEERQLLRRIECELLSKCAFITAASPGIAGAYAEVYGIARPEVVLNAFPLAQAAGRLTDKGTTQPSPSVYWFSQTIGPDRGLECAVRAIGLSKHAPHLYLRGTPAPGYIAYLQELSLAHNVVDRVHILAPDDPDEMERLASSYDIGLVAETGATHNRRVALTNKLFTFLLAGVPPLMSDIPAHQVFARDAGLTDLLYKSDDAADLARLIDGLLGDPRRLAEARAKAFSLGQEKYNWDHEQQKIQKLVMQHCSDRHDRDAEYAAGE